MSIALKLFAIPHAVRRLKNHAYFRTCDADDRVSRH